jgi:hypothetical protein
VGAIRAQHGLLASDRATGALSPQSGPAAKLSTSPRASPRSARSARYRQCRDFEPGRRQIRSGGANLGEKAMSAMREWPGSVRGFRARHSAIGLMAFLSLIVPLARSVRKADRRRSPHRSARSAPPAGHGALPRQTARRRTFSWLTRHSAIGLMAFSTLKSSTGAFHPLCGTAAKPFEIAANAPAIRA